MLKYNLHTKPMNIECDISDNRVFLNGELVEWLSWETNSCDTLPPTLSNFNESGLKDNDYITYLIDKDDNDKPLPTQFQKELGKKIDEGGGYYFYHNNRKRPPLQFLGFWVMRCLTDCRSVNNYSNVDWMFPSLLSKSNKEYKEMNEIEEGVV